MKYLWTEDTGAGLHFWKLVNQLFFDNALVVESKESNQGILYSLTSLNAKEEDEYYIAFDYVPDNQDIRNKYRHICKFIFVNYFIRFYTNSIHISFGFNKFFTG